MKDLARQQSVNDRLKKYELTAFVEWKLTGDTEAHQKTCGSALFTPYIAQGFSQNLNRAYPKRSRWITTLDTVRSLKKRVTANKTGNTYIHGHTHAHTDK